jgi:hypothetical protein
MNNNPPTSTASCIRVPERESRPHVGTTDVHSASAPAKRLRRLAGTALAAILPVFCTSCMATFNSTSFDVESKPSSSVSATNFRLSGVSVPEKHENLSEGLKSELEKLEKKQNRSLVAVPYRVEIRYRGKERTSDTTRALTGLLWVCSAFVFPTWDNTSHVWDVSAVLPGETVEFGGRESIKDVASWLMLPCGIWAFFAPDSFSLQPLAPPMAKAVFDSLTKERYDKAVRTMGREAKQRLLGGQSLSRGDERLLESDSSPETLAAWAKHPGNERKSRDALLRIGDQEELADIALHAAIPAIRGEAAARVSGLPEARFAALAVESADPAVGKTFLDHVSGDDALLGIAKNASAAPEVKSAAVKKIKRVSVLAAIAKSPDGPLSLKTLAIGRIGTESVLEDIATHAPVAGARKAAIGKIRNPAVLLASVLKDPEAENRLAALSRISHPKALAHAVRKSADANVRLQAVGKIADPAVLREVVSQDADESVRLSALEKISDDAVICDLARSDASARVRKAAVDKIQVHVPDLIASIAQRDADATVRRAALSRVVDQSVLAAVAKGDGNVQNRTLAIQRLKDETVLRELALSERDATVRRAALGRVTDPNVLAAAAKGDGNAQNRIQAIQRIEDETVLREIALAERDPAVRDVAWRKLPEPSRKALFASMARTLFRKAKKAEEDGNIDFCGFYIGMPMEDVPILVKYYDLNDGEWSCKSRGGKLTEFHLSLAGLRRVTKDGNSFDELAQAVANRVGTLSFERKERQQFIPNAGYWHYLWKYYQHETIDGIRLIVAEEADRSILAGLTMGDKESVQP